MNSLARTETIKKNHENHVSGPPPPPLTVRPPHLNQQLVSAAAAAVRLFLPKGQNDYSASS